MKILFYSDSPCTNTGMGRVIKEIGGRFKKNNFEVAYAGWHHDRVPHAKRDRLVHNVDKSNDYRKLEEIFKIEKPDIIFCLGDIFYFTNVPKLKELHPECKFIAYLNIDAPNLRYDFLDCFYAFDKLITTSKFGRKCIVDIPCKFGEVKTVYHGVDTLIFQPPQVLYKKKFNITIVAKNSVRKAIPISIKAFNEFCKDKDDVSLTIVTNPIDGDGYDLQKFISQVHGTEGKIRIINSDSIYTNISDKDLSEIYKLSTILLLCSLGEGFGLPIIEAMACGCIPICTDCSSMTELVDNRGWLVKPKAIMYSSLNQELSVPTSEDIQEKLEVAYSLWQKNLLTTKQKDCIRFAKTLTWDSCANELINIINNTTIKGNNKSLSLVQFPILYNVRSTLIEHKRTLNSKIKFIGVLKMGGYGDTLQLVPILKGIRKKYPNAYVFCIIENGKELLRLISLNNNLINGILEIKNQHYLSLIKTCQNIFDILYDVRYVSTAYGEEPTLYFTKYKHFYNGWAFSNHRIHILKDHVINIMIKSLGLEKYTSIEGIKLDLGEEKDLLKFGLEKDKYIILHNSTGNVGNLKQLPPEELNILNNHLISVGYKTVQVGAKNETKIPNISVDLLGKTEMIETISIVKYAKLYIGLEGFLYHLAHAVGTKSIVWMSSTPKVCFTYDSDIVLTTEECVSCWWNTLIRDWHKDCMMNEPRCINLPPLYKIIEAIDKELKINKSLEVNKILGDSK